MSHCSMWKYGSEESIYVTTLHKVKVGSKIDYCWVVEKKNETISDVRTIYLTPKMILNDSMYVKCRIVTELYYVASQALL